MATIGQNDEMEEMEAYCCKVYILYVKWHNIFKGKLMLEMYIINLRATTKKNKEV